MKTIESIVGAIVAEFTNKESGEVSHQWKAFAKILRATVEENPKAQLTALLKSLDESPEFKKMESYHKIVAGAVHGLPENSSLLKEFKKLSPADQKKLLEKVGA